LPNLRGVHQRQESPQVEALSVQALIAPDWSVDQAVSKWVEKIAHYLLDLDFRVTVGIHQACNEVRFVEQQISRKLLKKRLEFYFFDKVDSDGIQIVVIEMLVLAAGRQQLNANLSLGGLVVPQVASVEGNKLGEHDSCVLALLEAGVEV
jgi:uncharacterized protein (DUF2342 family)